MEGYHVEWNSKSKNDFTETSQNERKEKQEEITAEEEITSEEIPFGASNEISEKNNTLEKQKPETAHLIFFTDTLPKKKSGKKNDAPRRDEERKDVTKDYRKNYPPAVIGMILGIIAFSCLFWIFLGQLGSWLVFISISGLVCGMAGLVISLFANSYLKKHDDKYEGLLLAKGGMILSAVFLIAGALLFYFTWRS